MSRSVSAYVEEEWSKLIPVVGKVNEEPGFDPQLFQTSSKMAPSLCSDKNGFFESKSNEKKLNGNEGDKN